MAMMSAQKVSRSTTAATRLTTRESCFSSAASTSPLRGGAASEGPADRSKTVSSRAPNTVLFRSVFKSLMTACQRSRLPRPRRG